jgi:hypothetical protein
LLHQFEALAFRGDYKLHYPSYVCAWTIDARHQAHPHWIVTRKNNNWYRCVCGLRGQGRDAAPGGDNDIDLAADKLGHQRGQTLV